MVEWLEHRTSWPWFVLQAEAAALIVIRLTKFVVASPNGSGIDLDIASLTATWLKAEGDDLTADLTPLNYYN